MADSVLDDVPSPAVLQARGVDFGRAGKVLEVLAQPVTECVGGWAGSPPLGENNCIAL